MYNGDGSSHVQPGEMAPIAQFKAKVETQGGGNYQTMLNDALHSFVGHQEQPLEAMLRRVVREEIRKAS